MPYKVLQPFTNGAEEYRAGQVVDDGIEQCRNFTRLLGGASRTMRPYIESLIGEIDGCFIVLKRFNGGGEELRPGNFVDTRDNPWKNELALLRLNWIRRATESEVRKNTQPTHFEADSGEQVAIISDDTPSGEEVAGGGGPPRPLEAEPWKVKEMLAADYEELGNLSSVAKKYGCAISTVHRWANKHGIEIRKRGRPKAEGSD